MKPIQILKHVFLFGLFSVVMFCAAEFLLAWAINAGAAYGSSPSIMAFNIFSITLLVYLRVRIKSKTRPPFLGMFAICILIQVVSFLFYAYVPVTVYGMFKFPGGPDTVAVHSPLPILLVSCVFTTFVLAVVYLIEFLARLVTK